MSLRFSRAAIILSAFLTAPSSAAPTTAPATAPTAEPGLLARYTFDEGGGNVLKDHSGLGHHGTIHNAQWVKAVRGGGLAFQHTGSYVDCGRELARKLTADSTILAWARLQAAPCPDSTTNFTLADCEEYTRCGFIMRVDGQAMRWFYRASYAGRHSEKFSRDILANDTWYHLAVSRRQNRVTLYIDGLADSDFPADPPGQPAGPLTISSPGQSFSGTMDELAIYGRGLTGPEVLERYKQHAAAYGKDTSWFGRLRIEMFWYGDRKQAIAAVDFAGVVPVPPQADLAIELGPPGQAAVRTIKVEAIPESLRQDFTFDLAGLGDGLYEVRAIVRDGAGKTVARESAPFRNSLAPIHLPLPSQKALPPLPAPLDPLPITVSPDGKYGLVVGTDKDSFTVSSEFSYPGGGFNVLGQPMDPQARSEPQWDTHYDKIGPGAWRITAAGKDYGLSRTVQAQRSRVLIQDTLTNRTSEPLGILVRHYVHLPEYVATGRCVAGFPSAQDVAPRAIKTNPTVFLPGKDTGVGVVALDDVFIVQALGSARSGLAGLQTDTFALDAKATYTLEWAIYPTPTGDYYDFINQVRRDEGRNGTTIDGCPGFISESPFNRRSVPSPQNVELRKLKYALIHCLSAAADDETISLEGIEFMEYPKETRLLKEQCSAIHKKYPDMKVLFHVAHSLYATNKPERVFGDSRVIDAAGKHAVYAADPGPYFSPQRKAEGWNWYIYYPTMDNSFGKALLRSADFIRDQIGADGPFMDGFLWGYGGEFTYDRWDGHSAQIDPVRKTITRKMGSVLLLSQEALIAFCRKIRDRGGVVIANNSIITRTIGRETYIIHDRECIAGPDVHLASTPSALSNPYAIATETDVYRDVLDKLQWGNLYLYYGEGKLTHSSVPAQMYPITIEEIHAGWVKGRQRIITMRPGLYGWTGEDDLHAGWLCDSRGAAIPQAFVTTVDTSGVRTQVDLARDQCAVLRKVPLCFEPRRGAAALPVNVHVAQYDPQGVRIIIAGAGRPVLNVRDGEFRIVPGAEYVWKVGATEKRIKADAGGVLRLELELSGQIELGIVPAR